MSARHLKQTSNGNRRDLFLVRLKEPVSPVDRWIEVANGIAGSVDGEVVGATQRNAQVFVLRMPVENRERLAADLRVAFGFPQPYTAGQVRILQSSPCGQIGNLSAGGGRGVDIFVLDTGVNNLGNIFGTRLDPGLSFVAGDPSTADSDLGAHGTVVASIAAGGNGVGIADAATVIPIRFTADATGDLNALVLAIPEVTKLWQARGRRPAVALLAYSFALSPVLNTAIEQAVNAGLTYVVAAGNVGSIVSQRSPASSTLAITVAASMNLGDCDNDELWASPTDKSCFGPGVTIFAPGLIESVLTAPATGTSPAAAIVAGAAARFLAGNPSAPPPPPLDVRQHLIDTASTTRILGTQGSPDLTVFLG
jgi:hypothetical protein